MEDDARWIVVDGRRWRATDPAIPPGLRQELVDELMSARRAVAAANRSGDDEAVRAARRRVQAAKVALGERGAPWWDEPGDGARWARAEATISALTRHRSPATTCPTDVARVIGGAHWRRQLPLVKGVAADMAARHLVEITQRGEPVEGGTWRGPARIGWPTSRHDR